MRVALVTHPASSVLLGGPRVQLAQTAHELRALGVDVVRLDGEEKIPDGTVDLVHIFGAGMGTFHLARALHLRGIRTVLSPIYITRRAPWQVRVVMAYDALVRRVAPGFWTDYGMIAEMCRWATMLAPNTDVEGDLFRKAFAVPPQRIEKIPNGVEERFAAGDPSLFERTYGVRDFVLSVGHIGPARKNVARLVEALEGIDHPAVIVGRIEESAEAARILERARANGRLRILPHIDHDDPMLASAYAACRVFVLPSQFETPGIAALEAGLAGASVVITPEGGTAEYFLDLADYVDPASVADIRRGIGRSLERPRSDRLRDHIRDRYLWSHVARRTLRLYERVLSE